MKRLALLFLLLPLAFSLDCSNLEPGYIKTAVIDYYSEGDITIVFENEDAVVEDLRTSIRVVPQANASGLVYTGELTTDLFDNIILYYAQDTVTEETLTWSLEADVSSAVSYARIPVNPAFPYPLNGFPEEVRPYVEFTEVADTSPAIQAKVNELVSGVTDYLTAVSIIAEFVAYYLNYDLNYAPSTESASDVFTQQSGVCDEFSSLMASMLRNVGIPTRFVSGFAFTNAGSPDCSSFGPHSWIEVYVPDYGWLPTDPTYKEFFWVDAGHVPLYRSNDASTRIINASILYVDASFTIESPVFDIELLDYSAPEQWLEFDASLSFTEVNEDDYILLNVTVQNPYNEWVADTIRLSTTSSMRVVYNNKAAALIMPPKSSTNFYYIIATPETITEPCFVQRMCNIVYPVSVSLGSGGYKVLNITANPFLTIADMYEAYLSQIETSEREYTSNLAVSNKMINPVVVADEEPALSFNIQNVGNTQLDDVIISIEYDEVLYSENIGSLFISETVLYTKSLELPSTTGVKNVKVNVTADGLSLPFNLDFTIVSEPPFDFSIGGGRNYTSVEPYSLILSFSSIPSNFLNADIKVLINGVEVINRPFYFSTSTLSLDKELFEYGDNLVEAILTYDDTAGNEYLTRASTRVYSSVQRSLIDTILEYLNAIIEVFKVLIGIG